MIRKRPLLALAMVILLPAIVSAQEEPQPRVPQPPQARPQTRPKPPPRAMKGASVNLSGSMLSIDATEAVFGEVISEVAEQAGFELKITNNIKQLRLSTKFINVDIQKGIQRMMTLIGHKNYLIFYDSQGHISKLDIFEPGQKQPRKLNVPVVTKPSRSILKHPSRRRVRTSTETPKPPEVFKPKPQEEIEDISEGEPGVPFIPPTTEPEYIPPSKR